MDPKRDAYLRLMTEIEELEERVENFNGETGIARQSPDSRDAAMVADQLVALKMRLAEKRGELERLSDGCGKPHPW